MNCEFCQNRGGEWIQATVLRKRKFIFKPCPLCQKPQGRETGQLNLTAIAVRVEDYDFVGWFSVSYCSGHYCFTPERSPTVYVDGFCEACAFAAPAPYVSRRPRPISRILLAKASASVARSMSLSKGSFLASTM